MRMCWYADMLIFSLIQYVLVESTPPAVKNKGYSAKSTHILGVGTRVESTSPRLFSDNYNIGIHTRAHHCVNYHCICDPPSTDYTHKVSY